MQINSDWIAKSSETNESEWRTIVFVYAQISHCFVFCELHLNSSSFSACSLYFHCSHHMQPYTDNPAHTTWIEWWIALNGVCVCGELPNVHHFYHRYMVDIIISVMSAPNGKFFIRCVSTSTLSESRITGNLLVLILLRGNVITYNIKGIASLRFSMII